VVSSAHFFVRTAGQRCRSSVGLLTRDRPAYEYLPRTDAAFPSGDRFLALMAEADVFGEKTAIAFTFGTAYVSPRQQRGMITNAGRERSLPDRGVG
jgi:hypothetical protein